MMASNYYAIYNFDGKRIAKRIPRVAGAVELFEENETALEELLEIMDEFYDRDLIKTTHKPAQELSTIDFYVFWRASCVLKDLLVLDGYMETALFYNEYRENFERIVNEADDDFSGNMADVWME
jgi:hypothetical protein